MMHRMEIGYVFVTLLVFCCGEKGQGRLFAQRVGKEPNVVAFSVGKTAHQLGKGRVSYQKIFLNIGNGYDVHKHVFVAPVAGVYYFTVNALNYVEGRENHQLYLQLFRNQEYLVSLFEHKDNYGQASNSVLVKLTIADQVHVHAVISQSGLYGSPDQIYSTFSGYLIAPYRNTFAIFDEHILKT